MSLGYALLGFIVGYVLGRLHENRTMQAEMEAMAKRALDPASQQRARKDAIEAERAASTDESTPS
jgi:hypothetical protein